MINVVDINTLTPVRSIPLEKLDFKGTTSGFNIPTSLILTEQNWLFAGFSNAVSTFDLRTKEQIFDCETKPTISSIYLTPALSMRFQENMNALVVMSSSEVALADLRKFKSELKYYPFAKNSAFDTGKYFTEQYAFVAGGAQIRGIHLINQYDGPIEIRDTGITGLDQFYETEESKEPIPESFNSELSELMGRKIDSGFSQIRSLRMRDDSLVVLGQEELLKVLNFSSFRPEWKKLPKISTIHAK